MDPVLDRTGHLDIARSVDVTNGNWIVAERREDISTVEGSGSCLGKGDDDVVFGESTARREDVSASPLLHGREHQERRVTDDVIAHIPLADQELSDVHRVILVGLQDEGGVRLEVQILTCVEGEARSGAAQVRGHLGTIHRGDDPVDVDLGCRAGTDWRAAHHEARSHGRGGQNLGLDVLGAAGVVLLRRAFRANHGEVGARENRDWRVRGDDGSSEVWIVTAHGLAHGDGVRLQVEHIVRPQSEGVLLPRLESGNISAGKGPTRRYDGHLGVRLGADDGDVGPARRNAEPRHPHCIRRRQAEDDVMRVEAARRKQQRRVVGKPLVEGVELIGDHGKRALDAKGAAREPSLRPVVHMKGDVVSVGVAARQLENLELARTDVYFGDELRHDLLAIGRGVDLDRDVSREMGLGIRHGHGELPSRCVVTHVRQPEEAEVVLRVVEVHGPVLTAEVRPVFARLVASVGAEPTRALIPGLDVALQDHLGRAPVLVAFHHRVALAVPFSGPASRAADLFDAHAVAEGVFPDAVSALLVGSAPTTPVALVAYALTTVAVGVSVTVAIAVPRRRAAS